MIKHVGRHNTGGLERKVVVVFRELPGEEHMCLLAYTDNMPRQVHDPLMEVLESPKGQQVSNLADALHGTPARDGRDLLNVIHNEGYMKKVPTRQVIMTPNPTSSCRLDELNEILNQYEAGDEAKKRMEDIENGRGMKDTRRPQLGNEVGGPRDARNPVTEPAPTPMAAETEGVLDDSAIAKGYLQQAEGFQKQVETLMEEIKNLQEQAYSMDPSLKPKKRGRPKKSESKTESE